MTEAYKIAKKKVVSYKKAAYKKMATVNRLIFTIDRKISEMKSTTNWTDIFDVAPITLRQPNANIKTQYAMAATGKDI